MSGGDHEMLGGAVEVNLVESGVLEGAADAGGGLIRLGVGAAEGIAELGTGPVQGGGVREAIELVSGAAGVVRKTSRRTC